MYQIGMIVIKSTFYHLFDELKKVKPSESNHLKFKLLPEINEITKI